jgi:putative membrane protein insertion efficiency factor
MSSSPENSGERSEFSFGETMERNFSGLEKGLTHVIRGYRFFLSPYFGSACRFYPSCSEYAEQCLKEFGIMKALYLSLCRLLKCHPWHAGGVDFVPRKQDINKKGLN